jgi:hypothetical protein
MRKKYCSFSDKQIGIGNLKQNVELGKTLLISVVCQAFYTSETMSYEFIPLRELDWFHQNPVGRVSVSF